MKLELRMSRDSSTYAVCIVAASGKALVVPLAQALSARIDQMLREESIPRPLMLPMIGKKMLGG